MKKTLSVVAAVALAFTTSVFAGELFYDKPANDKQVWGVFGDKGSDSLNPACVAELGFNDGSYVQIIKDLANGEVYIWLKNNAWEIQDEVNQYYDLELNFTFTDGSVVNVPMQYLLLNKNTIILPQLNDENFLGALATAKEFKLIMPGTIQNAYIGLDGSTDALTLIGACMDAAKKIKFDEPAPIKPKTNA